MGDLRGPGGFWGGASASGRLVTSVADLDEQLLKIMVCPITHAPVVQVGDWVYSTDRETRHKYPIRDGIPIMLVDQAEVADQEEFDRVMAAAKADRGTEGETD
jgi:uncharacterized protein YbaR (Trm112 family)